RLTVTYPTYPSLLQLSVHKAHATPLLHSFPTRRSSDLHRDHSAPGARKACSAGAGAARPESAPPPPTHRHVAPRQARPCRAAPVDRKSTRLNSSHLGISYAVFCLKKKKNKDTEADPTRT